MTPRVPEPWDEVFLGMCHELSRRSKDPSTQVGAVIIDPGHILVSGGFNGPPASFDDGQVDWSRPNKYKVIVHAEANAIIFGLAKRGFLEGCVLYVDARPCPGCLLLAASARISEVVYGEKQPKVVNAEEWGWTQQIAEKARIRLRSLSLG